MYYSVRLLTMLAHIESNTGFSDKHSFRFIQFGGLHMWKFNLSHMPNLLDTNKLKAICVFDSVCVNVVRSLVE